jgi:hypothetical protein
VNDRAAARLKPKPNNAPSATDAVQQILSDAFAPYRFVAPEHSTDDGAVFCDIYFFAPCLTRGLCNICREDEARRQQAPSPAPKSEKQPTPQTTIEAIMYCVREFGLVALREPENLERLSRCDAAARAEINKRIEALLAKGMLL